MMAQSASEGQQKKEFDYCRQKICKLFGLMTTSQASFPRNISLKYRKKLVAERSPRFNRLKKAECLDFVFIFGLYGPIQFHP